MSQWETNRVGIAVIVAAVLTMVACTTSVSPVDQPGGSSAAPQIEPGPPTTLRVLAGSELADMQPILDEAAPTDSKPDDPPNPPAD